MDGYAISKESLNKILEVTGAMLEVGVFICNEHRDKTDSFRSDVLCDGVEYRLESNYEELKQLVKIITSCNNNKRDD